MNDTVALNTVLPGDDGWYRLSDDVQVLPVHSERIAMDGGTHYNRTVVIAPKGSRAQRATLQLPRLALLANDGQEEEVLLCAIHSKGRHNVVAVRERVTITSPPPRSCPLPPISSLVVAPPLYYHILLRRRKIAVGLISGRLDRKHCGRSRRSRHIRQSGDRLCSEWANMRQR